MESLSPSDLFAGLSTEEKADIERWRHKRGAMLQTRIQQEVQAKIEDEPSLVRESIPFVRLLVRSYDRSLVSGRGAVRKSVDEATLTVWSPTEDQLNLLREGAVLQFENIAVRSIYEGRLQLSANGRTHVAPLQPGAISMDLLMASGYVERKYSPIFGIHAGSRKLLEPGHAQVLQCEFDVIGVVLKVVESERDNETTIYLTDRSSLILRIQCGSMKGLGDLVGLRSSIARQCVEHPRIKAFRDVRMLPFDKIENCAVAEFRPVSCISSQSVEPMTANLQQWTESKRGRDRLQCLAAYLDAGLTSLQRPRAAFVSAVGYIAGFTVHSSSQLRILVDCGTADFQEWAFPFHLLQDIKLPNSSCDTVSLSPAEEGICSRLKHLGRFFRARGVLFRFILKRCPSSLTSFRPCEIEVCQINLADTEAISGIYDTMNLKN